MDMQSELNVVDMLKYPTNVKNKAKEYIKLSYKGQGKFPLAADDALAKALSESDFQSILKRKIGHCSSTQ